MNPKTRDEMLIILGLLEAIRFPIIPSEFNNGYYDLIEMIVNRYKSVLTELIGYKDEG